MLALVDMELVGDEEDEDCDETLVVDVEFGEPKEENDDEEVLDDTVADKEEEVAVVGMEEEVELD